MSTTNPKTHLEDITTTLKVESTLKKSRFVRRLSPKRIFLILFFIMFILVIISQYIYSIDYSRTMTTKRKTTFKNSLLLTYPMENLKYTDNWKNYIKLGNIEANSIFPEDNLITFSNENHVKDRGSSVLKLFSCYGKKKEEKEIYDFVILPIGCFGDFLSLCTSCSLTKTLINATYCGRKKLGLFLGDNFYPNGIRSWQDKRFNRELYTKFFRFPELQIKFYATSGNHDERPKYLYRQDPYWIMPYPFYRSGIQKSGNTNLEIFVISTNPHELRYKNNFLNQQVNWLDKSLEKSNAHWKIVMTHEPLIDIGLFYNVKGFKLIHPILIKHGVHMLICAHIHGIFLHHIENAYYQLISAGFINHIKNFTHSHRPIGYNHFGVGATSLFINKDFITVIAMDAKGHLIFQHKIPHWKKNTQR